jgi:hypothetical protein
MAVCYRKFLLSTARRLGASAAPATLRLFRAPWLRGGTCGVVCIRVIHGAVLAAPFTMSTSRRPPIGTQARDRRGEGGLPTGASPLLPLHGTPEMVPKQGEHEFACATWSH